jgi:uncharacterized membrane protein YdjX (TVP38/TMEM64 family)
MMNLIIGYLLIGVIFTIVFTVCKMIALKLTHSIDENVLYESVIEMIAHAIIMVFIWPIDLVLAIKGLITGIKLGIEYASEKEDRG